MTISHEDLFDQESDRLDAEMRARCERLAEEHGMPIKEVALELGRVLMVLGSSYIGNGLGLSADPSLAIAKRALKEFKELVISKN